MSNFEKNPLFVELVQRIDAYANAKNPELGGTGTATEAREMLIVSLNTLFDQVANLEETVRYQAENAHQGYHDVPCAWWECKKNICTAAQGSIPHVANRLAGKKP